jgi:hypothetical protein
MRRNKEKKERVDASVNYYRECFRSEAVSVFTSDLGFNYNYNHNYNYNLGFNY